MNSIIKKYTLLPNPIKASFWFIVASIIQKGISFITTPIFTRLLSTDEYGMVSIFHSWYNVFSIFLTLNLASGVYNKAMTKWTEKREELTSSLLGLTSIVTISFFAIYMVNIEFWNKLFHLTTPMMLTIFIQAFFSVAFNFWAASERYDYKYRELVVVTIAIAILSPLLGIISVKALPCKAEARIISLAFVQIAFGAFYYIKILRKGKKLWNKEYWKYALAFNIPLLPHYLAQTVLGSSDRIMIGNMVGNTQAAIYDVAYIISTITSLLTTAINETFIPYTFKAIKSNNTGNIRKYSVVLSAFVTAICVIAICFGPEIIKIVAIPSYYEARWVVPPVAASIYFSFVRSFYCNVEFYFEKTKFVMIASSIAAVLNVLLNWIFIREFGYIAAAYTTLVCYIVLMLLHYYMYRKICKNTRIKCIYNDNALFFMGIAILVFMIVISQFYDLLVIRYSIVVIILVAVILLRHKIFKMFKELKQ